MPKDTKYTKITSPDSKAFSASSVEADVKVSSDLAEELMSAKKAVKTPLLKNLKGNSTDYGTCTSPTETSKGR